MDEMLSQDEIQALLAGMDLSEDSDVSQPAKSNDDTAVEGSLITDDECDAIGEIANISMGSSATTLYSLVNRKVDITTPVVKLSKWNSVVEEYERPCIFIQIQYTSGLDGSNIMVLKEHDVKVITDLMMGGDGSNVDGEVEELHLSAISEAMNQMMGAAATSMSTMLGRMIDISPPQSKLINLNEFDDGGEIAPFLEDTFVKVSFRMQIDDLVDSTIVQLYPIDFTKSLYETFISAQAPKEDKAPEPKPYTPPTADKSAMWPDGNQMQMNAGGNSQPMNMGMNNQQMGMPVMGMPQMNMQAMNIQPAQFQSFGSDAGAMVAQENIGIIKDVPLEIAVELGRCKKSISEILDFAPGTIIELDKIAGEPIDVLVNGKFVAKGEVVVIEESFGVRVTEIIK